MSRTSITNMEKGLQHVSLHHLFDLADALGVPPADLLPADAASMTAARLPSRIKSKLQRYEEDDRAWVMQVVTRGTAEREGGDVEK